jgi:hypothetical protein
MVSAGAGVVCRDRALAECNVVGFSHADIEVQLRRQLKHFSGLVRWTELNYRTQKWP